MRAAPCAPAAMRDAEPPLHHYPRARGGGRARPPGPAPPGRGVMSARSGADLTARPPEAIGGRGESPRIGGAEQWARGGRGEGRTPAGPRPEPHDADTDGARGPVPSGRNFSAPCAPGGRGTLRPARRGPPRPCARKERRHRQPEEKEIRCSCFPSSVFPAVLFDF